MPRETPTGTEAGGAAPAEQPSDTREHQNARDLTPAEREELADRMREQQEELKRGNQERAVEKVRLEAERLEKLAEQATDALDATQEPFWDDKTKLLVTEIGKRLLAIASGLGIAAVAIAAIHPDIKIMEPGMAMHITRTAIDGIVMAVKTFAVSAITWKAVYGESILSRKQPNNDGGNVEYD